jgi:hypothetical protein
MYPKKSKQVEHHPHIHQIPCPEFLVGKSFQIVAQQFQMSFHLHSQHGLHLQTYFIKIVIG